MYRQQSRKRGQPSVPTSNDDEEMEATESMQVCGYVRRLMLRPDKDIGIDVALILFNDDATATFTLSPQLHLEHSMSRQQIKGHEVENMEHLTFTNGEIFKGKRPVKVCKCGIGTGLSVGKICFDKAACQLRISNDSTEPLAFSDGKTKLIMRGQLLVEPVLPTERFFLQGDSGSAVFLFENNALSDCIGMAIGYLYGNVCLVTPIRQILDALSEDQHTTYSLLTLPYNLQTDKE